MKKFLQFAPILVVLATSAYAVEPIRTDFINSKGEKIGTATLTDIKNGTLISVDVQLPEGSHAIHIHESGKC